MVATRTLRDPSLVTITLVAGGQGVANGLTRDVTFSAGPPLTFAQRLLAR